YSDTIFLINEGEQDYRAGDADDLFILQGAHITGRLQGGLGVNVVKFPDDQANASESVLLDPQGFLCEKNGVFDNRQICIQGLQLSNITQFHGRKNKQDKIFLIEKIMLVDTYAGENTTKPDYIYITEKSSKNLNIVVRLNTVVVQLLPRNTTNNQVIYKVPKEQTGNAYVQIPFNDQAVHQFYFEFSLDSLKALSIDNNTISFQFNYLYSCFNLTIQNTEALLHPIHNTVTKNPFFIESVSFIFDEKLRIKLFNEKTLYIQWHLDNSIDEIIQFTAPIAHRIDKAMVIQTLLNETIAIGSRKQEVLSTDGFIQHLVGNAGDAVYVIQASKNTTNPFPLQSISLYKLETDSLLVPTTTDSLDLRELVKCAKKRCGEQGIAHSINVNDQDLIFTLHANYYPVATDCLPSMQNDNQLAQIVLKGALRNCWYQDLDIMLDKYPMGIIFEKDNWKLVPVPLVFSGNKNIIVITDEDIKQNDELFILKNVGEYKFIRYNETDLFLSNMLNNITEVELYTVIFSNFFKYPAFKEKVLSLSLSFLDKSVILDECSTEINNAKNFYQQIRLAFNIDPIFFNESNLFYNNSNLSQQRTRRDIDAPLAISSSSGRPGIDVLFSYIPFKIRQFTNFLLNRCNLNYNFKLNYRQHKAFVENKINDHSTRLKEEKNIPAHCNKNNFFTEKDCVKNQSSLGLLGYCSNTKQVLVWFKKNMIESTENPKLSWFAIAYSDISRNTSQSRLSRDVKLSLLKDYLHFYNKDGCHQVINLSNLGNTTMIGLFPYLPEEGKQWLFKQWRHEKQRQDKILQSEIAIAVFKQQSLQIGLNYVGNAILLHTPVGDYFQVIGLRLNWQEHDPSYLLARWLSVIQERRLHGSNQLSTLVAVLIEAALLHPTIQKGYS
ncbi:MAG: hypothetical protein AAGB33_00265, partial [Cellulomonas sp.]|nr:hypothetical protein [Rickettsiella sp.]